MTQTTEIKRDKVARPARLERAASGFVDRRSIQLSYGRAVGFMISWWAIVTVFVTIWSKT